jgi:hypothetical protein
MDAAPLALQSRPTATAPSSSPPDAEKRTELILDALKRALARPGEHRLFRAGKLPGLFPSRAGVPAEAARAALADGLLETVRTEPRGKLIVEWVRATPRGIAFVHDHDSPKAVLRELRELIGPTRDGVPVWMDEARREIARAVTRYEAMGRELLARLDDLTGRIDAALRRADTSGPELSATLVATIPWATDALTHLDLRRSARAAGPCPLAELFAVVRERHPGLTVPEFHDGLRRLADNRAVRLGEAVPGAEGDPEFALIAGTEVFTGVER